MASFKEDQRNAYFECCLALASPLGIKKSGCGICEGKIAYLEKGGSGFGYDPLFIKHDYNKTFSELSENIKNKISHRAKAMEKIYPVIETLKT